MTKEERKKTSGGKRKKIIHSGSAKLYYFSCVVTRKVASWVLDSEIDDGEPEAVTTLAVGGSSGELDDHGAIRQWRTHPV